LSYILRVKQIKDNLIGPLLYFHKNEKEEKCRFWDLSPTFLISQTNLFNTHFLPLKVLNIVCSLNTKHLDDTFCLI